MDGWVTIGFKGDTKQLEKDIKASERQLQQYENEAERLAKVKLKAETDLQAYEEEKRLLQEMNDEALTKAQTEEEVNNILKLENAEMSQLNEKYAKQLSALSEVNSQIQKNEYNQSLMNGKIRELNNELTKSKGFDNIKQSIDKVGNSVQNVSKKVGKWALALIGVRSIYMGIRRAISIVSEDNEKVAGNLQAMRNVLANALLPVVSAIVNFLAKIMVYINYITKALFGKAIFDFSKATKDAKDNLKGGAKSAKEINKQLAGFDEMNVLSDTDTGGGGGGGADLTGFDPKLFDGEIPKWLKWIVKHKKEILAVMFGVGAALLAWKLGLGAIKALGIGLLIAGIVYAIESLLDYLEDPSWKNFGKIIQGIGVALLGLSLIVGSVPLAITAAIVLIVGTIIKYWDEIKKFLLSCVDWLTSKIDWVSDHFGVIGKTIYNIALDLVKNVIDFFDNLFKSIKGVFDGIIKFITGVFKGDWKKAWEGIKQIFENILNIMLGTFKFILDTIKSIFKNIGLAIIDILKGVWDKIKAGIDRVIEGVKKIFKGDLIGGLKDIFGGLGDILLAPFKWFKDECSKIIDTIIGWYKKAKQKLEELIGLQDKYNNKASGTGKGGGTSAGGGKGGGGSGGGGFAKGGIIYHSLPRLAVGGIINQPGRGVPLGSAIGGERGAEGVIPLTDSQQMALLGEAIGRYITINASITNTMNGRVISRELQKINNENDFAYNR